MVEVGASQFVIALASLIVGAALTSFGFLIKRRMSRAASSERAGLYGSIADLHGKLKSAGLSIDDIRALERSLFAPSKAPVSQAAIDAVRGAAIYDYAEDARMVLPDEYWSTYVMQARQGARLGVLHAEIEEALIGFEGLTDEQGIARLRDEFSAWWAYAEKAAYTAGAAYEGGTFQRTAEIIEWVRLAERYRDELHGRLRNAKQERGLEG